MAEDKELDAMATISKALDELDPSQIGRIIRWIGDRYKSQVTGSNIAGNIGAVRGDTQGSREEPVDLPTLYHSANPKTDGERALIAAYWLQVINGGAEWTSFAVNTELKQMGFPINNITDALTSLMKKKPALVMQTHKSGKSKQARKRYKLTHAGIQAAHQMVKMAPGEDPSAQAQS